MKKLLIFLLLLPSLLFSQYNLLYYYQLAYLYFVENYDTYAKDDIIYVGEKAFNGSGLKSGQYYFSFYYKGKIKAYNYSGSLIISK